MSSLRGISGAGCFWGMCLVAAGCANGGGGADTGPKFDAGADAASDSAVSTFDTGPRPDTGPGRDTGMVTPPGDAGPDTGPADPCATAMCAPFEFCMGGRCVPYPACTPAGGCPAGSTCRRRICLPSTRDFDGDMVPAGMDCDETNPRINPNRPEVCNAVDDNCSGAADEGDPGALCAGDPSGGVCIMGGCGCPGGTFDFDRNPANGCECRAEPGLATGGTCLGAIDVGEFADNGMELTVSGNVLPDDREVWYRFRATDSADTTCDRFHVRVQLTANPGNAFEFTVFNSDCTTVSGGCMDKGYSDFSYSTDFTMGSGPGSTGECPCAPSPARPGANYCTDNTQSFTVRVRRKPGSPLNCMGYTLEISNAKYRT